MAKFDVALQVCALQQGILSIQPLEPQILPHVSHTYLLHNQRKEIYTQCL